MRRPTVLGLMAVALALAASGCGAGADSVGAGSTSSDSIEEGTVERLLLEYTDADPGFELDLGDVEFTDCRPIGDVEYEGHPAFYCEAGGDRAIASLCVARVGEQLFFSGGKVMCEEPFELAYPSQR